MISAKELEENLCHFTGTEMYHRLTLGNMLATDGVAYFAENAEAYWLVTDVSAIVPTLDSEFVGISIESSNNKATIVYDDGNGNILHKHKYDYTDLPEGVWEFYVIDNVMLLPSEY